MELMQETHHFIPDTKVKENTGWLKYVHDIPERIHDTLFHLNSSHLNKGRGTC